jgi:hypothetical protein
MTTCRCGQWWWPMRRLNLLKLSSLLLSLIVCDVSNGQGLTTPQGAVPMRPIEGSTGGLHLPYQSQSPTDLTVGAMVHKDPYGKPCIKIAAFSLRKTDFRKIFDPKVSTLDPGTDQTQNRQSGNLFEHIISAENHCGHTIKLKVCYYGSQTCLPVDVPGYGHQRASLGTYPAMPDFRYQYTEQF